MRSPQSTLGSAQHNSETWRSDELQGRLGLNSTHLSLSPSLLGDLNDRFKASMGVTGVLGTDLPVPGPELDGVSAGIKMRGCRLCQPSTSSSSLSLSCRNHTNGPRRITTTLVIKCRWSGLSIARMPRLVANKDLNSPSMTVTFLAERVNRHRCASSYVWQCRLHLHQ